jgi:hypothetical protein
MMGQKKMWSSFIVLTAMLVFGMTGTPGIASDGLFADADRLQGSAPQMSPEKPDPTVVMSRHVRVNFNLLKGDRFQGGAEFILLNLFDNISFQATLERFEERSSTRFTWFGRVAGTTISQVVLVAEDGILAGNVLAESELYQIRAVSDGIHAIRKIEQANFPEEAPPIPVPAGPDQSESLSPSPQSDDGSLIDVLVVYTAAVANYFSNNLVNVMANIQLAIDETNQSYVNSGVAQRVRLVHAAQVNYTETGTPNTDLSRLQNPGDGYLDEVHSMRDTYGADLVSLWVENLGSSACGIGYLMTAVSHSFESHAFTVVARNCATGYYSFGHEMGHNMGAHHDRYVAPEDGAFSYSHGYVYTPGRWRTVMAYNNQCGDQGYSCTRIPYWSNPNMSYQGFPTGISENAPDSANNRLSLNNTANTVANFRPSVIQKRAVRDFNDDGKTDILWQQTTSGTVAIWLMNGAAISSVGLPGVIGADWQIKGVGDFDNDGRGDILWQHDTGTVAIWLMNGSTISSVGIPGAISTGWQIRGVGDFNNDGKSDVLWQHTSGTVAIWQMNGMTISSVGVPGSVQADWQVKGIGDFDGDGKSDILWYHPASGMVAFWQMNGMMISSVGVPGAISTDWQVKGVGDFNNDGKSDVLWQHTSGTVAIWQMDGMTISSVGVPGSVPSDWQVKGVGDFDGDGKSDILWYHPASGTVAFWQMNGMMISSVGIPGAISTDWQIMNK